MKGELFYVYKGCSIVYLGCNRYRIKSLKMLNPGIAHIDYYTKEGIKTVLNEVDYYKECMIL